MNGKVENQETRMMSRRQMKYKHFKEKEIINFAKCWWVKLRTENPPLDLVMWRH